MVCLPPGSRVPYLADPIHCSQQQWEAAIVIFIVQSRKWTHREVKRLAGGHTASKQQSWFELRLLAPEPPLSHLQHCRVFK